MPESPASACVQANILAHLLESKSRIKVVGGRQFGIKSVDAMLIVGRLAILRRNNSNC